ncbi:MAG TPA: LysM peptidoglycan-binding domain-containing M23 family metallopeptidase [Candidatus Deferrimicrobium sp.]|nr:LysM peptidoglycan-binding domain-containing M23 family metallopeptidase [Candidatus Deferrimicrobium sp.]
MLCVLAGAGCSSLKSPAPAPPPRPASNIFHVVKPGENLFRIGKAYDVSFEELAKANRLKDASQIYVGQRLLIPGANRQLPVDTIAPAEAAPVSRMPPPAAEVNGDLLLWPVSGTINSSYGPRGSSFHDGIDIAAPEGTPILAIERGEVIYSDQLRGYGNIVILRHQGGMVSVYAHNQVNLVREGQQVGKGEVIAKVGSTGRVTGPHLHLEIRKNNMAQDPLRYLPQLCCMQASDNVAPKD